MKPFLNTDIPDLSPQMAEALDALECHCVGRKIKDVNVKFVENFLTENYNERLASQFDAKYLFA